MAKRKTPMKYVAVFEVDRAFGGREEGGWWYDRGEKVLEWFVPARIAKRCAAFLRGRYPDTGKRGSVLGGEDYDVAIYDQHEPPPAFFPDRRPQYS